MELRVRLRTGWEPELLVHLGLISLAGALIVFGYLCIFRALSQQFELQQDINTKLPATDKFVPFFWSWWTWKRLRKLENEYFPGSNRARTVRKISAIGVALSLSGLLLGMYALRNR